MFSWLKPLLGFFQAIAQYFQEQQLINAGKAEETVEAVKVVEQEKKDAEIAISKPDVERDGRLRKRFDRG